MSIPNFDSRLDPPDDLDAPRSDEAGEPRHLFARVALAKAALAQSA